MTVFQEATFHDRQCVIGESTLITSSLSYVDITGATLTTKDLSLSGAYLIWFSVLLSGSLNNTTASFRLLGDGVPIGMDRDVFLKIKDSDIGYTIMGCVPAESGEVLKFQWLTDKGTLTLSEYNFILDGVPVSRVVE